MHSGTLTLTALITDIPLAVVDVETTGLHVDIGDRVCEVAVLRVAPGQPDMAFSSLVNPGRPISPQASQVNRLTDADMADAPRFGELIASINPLLEGAALVAHNAPFDIGFLSAEYAIAGVSPPDVPVLDTLALARRCFNFPHNNLGALAREFHVRAGRGHRAAGDALTTYNILRRMITRMGRLRYHTLEDFLVAQGPPTFFRPPDPPDWLPEPLQTAVSNRQPIAIRYHNGSNTTERTVEPLWANDAYLIAYCQLRAAQRTFRFDRILAAWWPDENSGREEPRRKRQGPS